MSKSTFIALFIIVFLKIKFMNSASINAKETKEAKENEISINNTVSVHSRLSDLDGILNEIFSGQITNPQSQQLHTAIDIQKSPQTLSNQSNNGQNFSPQNNMYPNQGINLNRPIQGQGSILNQEGLFNLHQQRPVQNQFDELPIQYPQENQQIFFNQRMPNQYYFPELPNQYPINNDRRFINFPNTNEAQNFHQVQNQYPGIDYQNPFGQQRPSQSSFNQGLPTSSQNNFWNNPVGGNDGTLDSIFNQNDFNHNPNVERPFHLTGPRGFPSTVSINNNVRRNPDIKHPEQNQQQLFNSGRNAILGRPVVLQQGTTSLGNGSNNNLMNPFLNECIQRCPATSEYNPVCGTDSVTYYNPGRLLCARNCGARVSVFRRGKCS